MPTIAAAHAHASHREKLATVCAQPAKADLKPQPSATELPELAMRAIRKGHGKVAAAAESLSLSDAHLGRLVNDGDLKLRHLAALGPTTLAALGRELLDQYGSLESPEQHARTVLREIAGLLQTLEQFVDYVANKRIA